MKIYTVIVGSLQTNCYLAADQETKETLIIDPGAEPEKILSVIKKNKLIPRLIVNTHGHPDHIGANRAVKEKVEIPLAIHRLDAPILEIDVSSFGWEEKIDSPSADQLLEDSQSIKVGKLKFTVLHTPGHTPGGICLKGEGVIFTGDTLFAFGIGRTDLLGSSESDMRKSLKKLLALDEKMKVYPGHGPATTIGKEKGNI